MVNAQSVAGLFSATTHDTDIHRNLRTPAERQFLTVDDVLISYRLWRGAGPSASLPLVVLIHGNAARSEWWDAIAPSIAAHADADVVAVDLSGHGESQWRPEYHLDGWAREVMAVVDRVGAPAGTILIGHSMGGLVALTSAWSRPADSRGVILLDTPLLTRSAGELAARRAVAERPLRRYATLEDAQQAFQVRPAMERGHRATWSHVARSSFCRVEDDWVLHFDPRIYLRATDVQSFMRPFPPDTHLFRAASGMIPEDMAAVLADWLPEARHLAQVPGGHHFLLENPQGTIAILGTLIRHLSSKEVPEESH